MQDVFKIRKDKLEKLKEKNLDPFKINRFCKTQISKIKEEFIEGKLVKTAGRILSQRLHGKSCFIDIKDFTDKIQVYARKDILKERYEDFLDLDIGDIVGIEGELFKTRTGEVTINVKDFVLLSKSLRVLPEKWHGLKDTELRFRYRYLDLISNPKTKEIFLMRTKILDFIRNFLKEKGFIEVETPILQILPGGAAGSPFKTHHKVLDLDLYLRIAPELYLKRLLVGGFERVFEIGRNFRNEGISTKHNPEFTMLEAYAAYTDYEFMMDLCEELFSSMAKEFFKKEEITFAHKKIDLKRPWKRISFAKILEEKLGVLPTDSEKEISEKILRYKDLNSQKLSRSQITKLCEEIVESECKSQPVFITDYFSFMSPLAKPKAENPNIAERFELFIGGLEIGNAYTELNDPFLQRKKFEEQLEDEDADLKKIDEDFLTALEYGMPPASGLGLGIDRICMLFTDTTSIREVILFPLLKPSQ